MRKYFEKRIEIFEEDFRPGIPFLRDLLSQVPITSLPTWYSLPRMTSSIFDSIVEKHLQTPKIFEQYLLEQPPEERAQLAIWEKVFSSPDLSLPADLLQEELNLSPEEFHEAMLYLEFRFLCCISYRREGDLWREVVTPFAEWHDYQLHLVKSIGTPLKEEEVSSDGEDPFTRIEALAKMLKLIQGGANSLSDPKLLERLLEAEFLEEEGAQFIVTDRGEEWLEMTPFDKAVTLYRNACYDSVSDKDLRMIEKAVQRVVNHGWVPLSSFVDSIVEPLGDAEPVMLRCVSRGHWEYQLPKLTPEQRQQIEEVIYERLVEAGIAVMGTYEGALCFQITPFGKMVLA